MSGDLDSLDSLVSLLGTIVDGYTRCKEIDVQREEIRANYRIEKRKLDLQKKALEYQYKKNMEEIRVAERSFLEELALRRFVIEKNTDAQNTYFQKMDKCLEVALDPQSPKELRDRAAMFYKDASEVIRLTITNCSNLLDAPYKSIDNILSYQQKEIKE